MILKEQVAIVTAAGSGIGRAGACILGRHGATVLVSDRDEETAAETAGLIVEDGGRAEAVALDVLDDAAVARLIDRTAERYGRIDIVHSHAGIQIEGTLEEVRPGGMDDSWRLNVRSHFILARHAVPHMKRRGSGSIVITSSNSGVLFDRGMIAYATSKHAAVAMVRQMALDYARFNVRVNALCPGWVDTAFNEPFMRQMGGRSELERYVAEQIPMGRWASVDEIAEGILFLASNRSSFMTGQALVIDGGESIA